MPRGPMMAPLLPLLLLLAASCVAGETVLRTGVVPHTPHSR